MKFISFIKTAILLSALLKFYFVHPQKFYNRYFTNESLRVDFYLVGNNSYGEFEGDDYKIEPFWGGSKVNLIDTFNYGTYFFKIIDARSKELIYSRGFCSLFEEWQKTKEATAKTGKFEQTIVFPKPNKKFIIEIYKRNKKNSFIIFYSKKVNPRRIKTGNKDFDVETTDIYISEIPEKALDIVFLAEGYTKNQQDKFIGDVKRFADTLFGIPPFSNYKSKVNIRAVKIVSKEEGADRANFLSSKMTAN